ncbi:MAG: HD domain-containing protein [Thermomicrobiales bacterium]
MMASPDANALLSSLRGNLPLTGDAARDVPTFLIHHGFPETAKHGAAVAREARQLALRAGADAVAAERAGWFHDVSAVFPNAERIAIARTLGVAVLPEEITFPMIVHQKLSAVLARDLFGERDVAVLSAVACHTTLKADATTLDTVLFVADKIAWDQPGSPPYLGDLLAALYRSLDAAALVYLHYLWERRETLGVIHPCFRDAYRQRSVTL